MEYKFISRIHSFYLRPACVYNLTMWNRIFKPKLSNVIALYRPHQYFSVSVGDKYVGYTVWSIDHSNSITPVHRLMAGYWGAVSLASHHPAETKIGARWWYPQKSRGGLGASILHTASLQTNSKLQTSSGQYKTLQCLSKLSQTDYSLDTLLHYSLYSCNILAENSLSPSLSKYNPV